MSLDDERRTPREDLPSEHTTSEIEDDRATPGVGTDGSLDSTRVHNPPGAGTDGSAEPEDRRRR
jgi:hypothetical protein